MNTRKWKIGFCVALLFGLLTAGSGVAAGMKWQAFIAVLCTALITNLGSYLMKHPIEAIQDKDDVDGPPAGTGGYKPPQQGGFIRHAWLNCLGAFCLAIFCLTAPVMISGCKTQPTREAVIFYSFKDTWTVAHTAFGGWCERVVQGKTDTDAETKVDAAWNKFRAAFKVSLHAASMNYDAATPADVQALATEVVTLIRQLGG